jgi:hypothetical protein
MEPISAKSSFSRSLRCLLLTGVVAKGLLGCAEPGQSSSSQGSWEPIPTDEASLVLYAPGLESPRVQFTRMVDGFTMYEMGHWNPATGGSPVAEIVVLRISSSAPSGMTFVREPPLEERIKGWFGENNVETESVAKFKNVLGPLEYMRFTRYGAIQCVFMRQYGDTFSDQRDYFSDGSTGHGNIMIRGYYCVAPNRELSQSTLERFLTGIGLKGFGVPAKPANLGLIADHIAACAAARGLRGPALGDASSYQATFASMV